jgi:hypothetical protein
MAVMNVVSNCGKTTDDRGTAASLVPEARAPADKTPDDRVSDPSLQPQARTAAKHPMRIMRFLITLEHIPVEFTRSPHGGRNSGIPSR